MNFHPYSEIFPLIEGSSLDELADDIKANGLREKIWLYEGKILDGRNRFIACKKAKVDPKYRKYTGKDPLAFVVSLNVQRRHLTESQRAMAAARIVNMRQGERNDLAPRGAKSQADAATDMDVSRRSVQRAKKVIEAGSVALQQAVERDEIPLARAASVTDLPKSEQLAAAKKKPLKAPEPKPAPSDHDGIPEYTPDEAEEDAALERAAAEIDKSMDAVMASDDRFPALRAEIKRLAGLLSMAEQRADHYQNQAGVAVREAKKKDREIDALKKKLTKAGGENERLVERIAIMESS